MCQNQQQPHQARSGPTKRGLDYERSKRPVISDAGGDAKITWPSLLLSEGWMFQARVGRGSSLRTVRRLGERKRYLEWGPKLRIETSQHRVFPAKQLVNALALH